MCDKCVLVSLTADDIYTCYKCGYKGRTDSENPGHCPNPECRHDMRDTHDTRVDSMMNG
jgi:rubrerythrin